MPRSPSFQGAPIIEAVTLPTEAICGSQMADVLVVDGPFGWSGIYPLDLAETRCGDHCVRHCNLYFVKLNASPSLQQRAAAVVEKTHYRLAEGARVLVDAQLCTVCLNVGCPQNRNGVATVDQVAGKLVLPL